MSGFVLQGIINIQSCSNDGRGGRYSLRLALIWLDATEFRNTIINVMEGGKKTASVSHRTQHTVGISFNQWWHTASLPGKADHPHAQVLRTDLFHSNMKFYIKNELMQSWLLKFVFLNKYEQTHHIYQRLSCAWHWTTVHSKCESSTELWTNSRLNPSAWNNLVANVFLCTSLILWV